MWQGCQCRLRRGVATAETPPTTPQVDCFKIVFDVTMGQGGKVVNAAGGAALLPEKYHHQRRRLIVSKFVVDTGQRTTTRWQRLIFYFSMRHLLSHMTSKRHQQTLSPTPPVDCFSIFSMKVNGAKVGCAVLLLNRATLSPMLRHKAQCPRHKAKRPT